MESHIVKVLKAYYVTHDVKCFVVEKPEGYDFIPGQATNVSINRPQLLVGGDNCRAAQRQHGRELPLCGQPVAANQDSGSYCVAERLGQ